MTARELIERLKLLSERELEMEVVIDGRAGDFGVDEYGYIQVGNVGILPSQRVLID